MLAKLKKKMIWVALFIILVSCFFLWFAKTQMRFTIANYIEVYSSTGEWDLTDIDFETSVVRLSGNVQHIPGEILTPQQFEENEEKIQIGAPVDHNEGRTARLNIIMPSEQYYGVYTAGDYARVVYINGELRGTVGVPANDKSTFVPEHGEIVVDAFANGSELEIVVQGGNFVHRGGSIYTNVIIGSSENVKRFANFQTSVELFMVGMLFLLFIVHMLFASVLKEKALNICFSLLCFVFSLRISLVGSKVFYIFFEDVSWYFAIKMEYLTVAVSSVLLLYIVYMQFSESMNKHVMRVFRGIFYSFCVIFIFANTYINSFIILGLNVVHFCAIIYCMWAICAYVYKKYKTKSRINRIQKITVFSFVIFSYATISDVLYYVNISLFGVQDSLTEIAIVMFAILEALAVFYTTMKSVQTARNAEREALAHAKNLENLNKMKTEFLQDISHEMRTPLTVISTGLDFAYRQLNKADLPVNDTKETINTIRDETSRLGRMVGGMVDMAALLVIEERKKVNFSDVLTMCLNTYSILMQKNETSVYVDIQQNLPPVYIDEDSYVRAVNNFLTNAVRHTKGGKIYVNALAKGPYISVNITDTGEGISAEMLPNVTKRGVSGSGGTGLGLYICKTVISAHGGELVIESEAGKGTSITFTIPVYGGQEEGHNA